MLCNIVMDAVTQIFNKNSIIKASNVCRFGVKCLNCMNKSVPVISVVH